MAAFARLPLAGGPCMALALQPDSKTAKPSPRTSAVCRDEARRQAIQVGWERISALSSLPAEVVSRKFTLWSGGGHKTHVIATWIIFPHAFGVNDLPR